MYHGFRQLSILAFVATALACADGPAEPGEDGWTIGPAGGTVATDDGRLILVVPAGALTASLTITATPASAPGSLPVIAGTAWELGPDGTEFAVPAELTIRYDPADVSGDPANLRVVEVLESAGELELAQHVGVDADANTVTGAIHGFSTKGVATCGAGCLPPPDLTAEYQGVMDGVELSWPTPTWSWVRIYRAVFRQCELGETSGQYGPYTCVSSSAEALTPPPECVAPGTAPDGRPCTYKLHTHALGGWGGISDRWLGSRGAVFWYQARGGLDDEPLRAWSFPPQQVTYFGTPDPPEAPANFSAQAASETSIQLSWQPTPTASGYELERLGTNGASFTLPFTDFALLDENLIENTTYNYRIRSVNEHGVSGWVSASGTTGDVGGGDCLDFELRLDFDPVQVAPGGSDMVPVFIDRLGGFNGQVELVLYGPGGPPNDVFSTWAFTPNPAAGEDTYSTLSFTGSSDLSAGEAYDLEIRGGSPLLETATSVCTIPVTFEVVGG